MTCYLSPGRSSEWTGCIDPIQWPKAAAPKNVSNQRLLTFSGPPGAFLCPLYVISVVLKVRLYYYMSFRPGVSKLWSVLCCRKLYVVLSVVLCLLASSLVAFFLYPRSVVVVDDGIHAVAVHFDHSNTKVQMNMTVGFLSWSHRAIAPAQHREVFLLFSLA